MLKNEGCISATHLASLDENGVTDLVGNDMPNLPERKRLLNEVSSRRVYDHRDRQSMCLPSLERYWLYANGGIGSLGTITLQTDRLRIICLQLGQVLIDKYDGLAANLIRQAQHSALRLVDLLTTQFRGFQDHAIYRYSISCSLMLCIDKRNSVCLQTLRSLKSDVEQGLQQRAFIQRMTESSGMIVETWPAVSASRPFFNQTVR